MYDSETITALVVDDESADLEALSAAAAAAGYRVITASDGRTALELFHAHAEEIGLLLTDVAMSPMNGCELARLLVHYKPDLKVIFVSGYIGRLLFASENPAIPHFGFLRKPVTHTDLAQLCQHMGIPFTLQNCVDDRQAGQAGYITDDVMNLQVHLVQRFLHVLDVTTRHLN